MTRGMRAWAGGCWAVMRAPALVAGATLVTLAAAAPFGVWIGLRLQSALANQPPITLGSTEIDPEWWMEYRSRATGLEATFTPSIIGAAAPLDNLSALLDGTPRPFALAVPVAIGGLAWAFLWGGLLERFASGRALGVRLFCRAGLRRLPRFVAIALTSTAAALVLYVTVHAVLFGPVYDWLAAHASSERDAFFWRVGLYVVFAALLAMVSVIADFTRITSVVAGAPSFRAGLMAGARFVRANRAAAATVYALNGIALSSLVVGYATLETLGGVRVAGWRGVIVAQAYIAFRIGLRLALAAAEVGLLTDGAGRVTAAHDRTGER